MTFLVDRALPLARRSFLQGAASAAAVMLAPLRAWARDKVGVVADVAGSVSGEEEGGAPRTLAKDAPVHINEAITTSARSGVGVRLERGLAMRLGARGNVKVAALSNDAGGRIVLGAGPLLVDRATPRSTAAGSLAIETPYCTVTLDDDTRLFAGPSKGVFGVFVDRGSVTVAARGKRFRLQQGEGTDIRRPGGTATLPARWKSPRIRVAFESVQAKPAEEPKEKK